MRIDILHTEGCQNYEKTLQLVRVVVSDLRLSAQTRTLQVHDTTEAERLHFFGSPSVQIDGVDIEVSVRDREDFVFG